MSKKLILTGWGHKDYACAAALALHHYGKADILGISKRRLPEFLESVSDYTEIAILGVSLAGDAQRLASALQRLRDRKVRIRWISALAFPEWMGAEIREALEASVCGSDLLEAVARTFAVDSSVISRMATEGDSLGQRYAVFLEAAMYFYRNFQDEQAYPRVIRHMAAGDDESQWSDAERQMIAHYRKYGRRELVGKSAAIVRLQEQINKVSRHPRARVLIVGESGTGKETVAQQIHFKSARKGEPFIAFNCASVAPALLESRFLGYERGAFTGANERRGGVFEAADGGTLFLDEISELPRDAQGILLRVLEGGRFQRLGGNSENEVDVRVIAATNRDLPAMVRDGAFRDDLYQRLNVIQLRMPPLREHREDIPAIARSYRQNNGMRGTLSQAQNEALMDYDYPGNVRELNNLLERAEVMEIHDYRQLVAEHKAMNASLQSLGVAADPPDDLREACRRHVQSVLAKCAGNKSAAAQKLGISRNTLREYLDK